ncbi:unnamed protein product [Thlaspi arvense]|uniref:Reverse transcriptase zinc-binding domain-containing protein n=1 Tax=Thlaspi arvense TaxID=13288 RepID=A0AAU9T7A5_THLAR|nr:unnamed protein product [Thlaspi arvense]
MCSQEPETLDHLFFGCSFSSGIWGAFSVGLGLQPSHSLLSVAGSISGNSALCGSAKGVLARLHFQVSIYQLWKERNSRIFTSTFASMASTRSVIDRTIRDRLLSFPAANVSSPSLLELYFLLLSPAMYERSAHLDHKVDMDELLDSIHQTQNEEELFAQLSSYKDRRLSIRFMVSLLSRENNWHKSLALLDWVHEEAKYTPSVFAFNMVSSKRVKS